MVEGHGWGWVMEGGAMKGGVMVLGYAVRYIIKIKNVEKTKVRTL